MTEWLSVSPWADRQKSVHDDTARCARDLQAELAEEKAAGKELFQQSCRDLAALMDANNANSAIRTMCAELCDVFEKTYLMNDKVRYPNAAATLTRARKLLEGE